MEHEQVDKTIARRSAFIYIPITLCAAALFLVVAGLGDYPPAARIGGALWVGLLSLIVSMPLATTWVKKVRRSEAAASLSA